MRHFSDAELERAANIARHDRGAGATGMTEQLPTPTDLYVRIVKRLVDLPTVKARQGLQHVSLSAVLHVITVECFEDALRNDPPES